LVSFAALPNLFTEIALFLGLSPWRPAASEQLVRRDRQVAHPLAESMLLGDVAIRMTGKQLEYDGKIGKITNNADADKFIKTAYRTGW
jgi:hypothetical protein